MTKITHIILRLSLALILAYLAILWGCSKGVDPAPPPSSKVTLVIWYDHYDYVDTARGYFNKYDSSALVTWTKDSLIVQNHIPVTLTLDPGTELTASYSTLYRGTSGSRVIDTVIQQSRRLHLTSNAVWRP